jgi:hypothetical protein
MTENCRGDRELPWWRPTEGLRRIVVTPIDRPGRSSIDDDRPRAVPASTTTDRALAGLGSQSAMPRQRPTEFSG